MSFQRYLDYAIRLRRKDIVRNNNALLNLFE